MTAQIEYQGELSTKCTHLQSNNSIETDAPIDNQGKGQNFSPTDLVATALGSCMLTVMGIKAASSDIAFAQVSALIKKEMGTEPRRISKIDIEITVKEKWSDKERVIMETTAKNCPVAKSIHPDTVQNVAFIYT